jgi:choline-sulfatase
VRDCERELRRIVDPEDADSRAHRDQAVKAESFGGREAILAKGTYGYSPVPGISTTSYE